jgi:hypothetical protein
MCNIQTKQHTKADMHIISWQNININIRKCENKSNINKQKCEQKLKIVYYNITT